MNIMEVSKEKMLKDGNGKMNKEKIIEKMQEIGYEEMSVGEYRNRDIFSGDIELNIDDKGSTCLFFKEKK